MLYKSLLSLIIGVLLLSNVNAAAIEIDEPSDVVLLVQESNFNNSEKLSEIIEEVENQIATHNSILSLNSIKFSRRLIKVDILPDSYIQDMKEKKLGIDLSTNLAGVLGKLYLNEALDEYDHQSVNINAANAIYEISSKYGADQLILVTDETVYDRKVNGHAGQEFLIQVTTNGLMSDQFLIAHEFGHVDGLYHSNDSSKLMYPSQTDVEIHDAYSAEDLERMKRYFSGDIEDIIVSPIDGSTKKLPITDCGCLLAANYVQESNHQNLKVKLSDISKIEFSETESIATLNFEFEKEVPNNFVMKVTSGSAELGEDFFAVPFTVIDIEDGINNFNVEVELLNDNEYEDDEFFNIEFLYGAKGQQEVKLISEDMQIHNVSAEWDRKTFLEGEDNTIKVNFTSSGEFTYPEDVTFNVLGSEYLNLPSQVTLIAGQSNIVFTITPNSDGIFNKDRGATINLESTNQFVKLKENVQVEVINNDIAQIIFDVPQSISIDKGDIVIKGRITNSITSSERLLFDVSSDSSSVLLEPLVLEGGAVDIELKLKINDNFEFNTNENVTIQISHPDISQDYTVNFELVKSDTEAGNEESPTNQPEPLKQADDNGAGGSFFWLIIISLPFLSRCWKRN